MGQSEGLLQSITSDVMKTKLLIPLLALPFLVISCDDQKANSTAEEMKKAGEDAKAAAEKLAAETKVAAEKTAAEAKAAAEKAAAEAKAAADKAAEEAKKLKESVAPGQ